MAAGDYFVEAERVLQGVLAARPSASVFPGYTYFATDGSVSRSDGTSWITLSELPWHHFIPFTHPPDLNTATGGGEGFPYANTLADTGSFYHGVRYSSAQNDEIGWDLILAAGTWSISLLHWTGPDRGIASIRIDGTDVGTIDTYSAGVGKNQQNTVSGVAVAVGGKHRVSIKGATKNASSSGYSLVFQALEPRRTA